MGMLADRKDRRARARAHDAFVQAMSHLQTTSLHQKSYQARYDRLVEDEHDLSRIEDEYTAYQQALASAQEAILDDHFYLAIRDSYYEPQANAQALEHYRVLLKSQQAMLTVAADECDRYGGVNYTIIQEKLHRLRRCQQDILDQIDVMPIAQRVGNIWDSLNELYASYETEAYYLGQQSTAVRPSYQRWEQAQAQVDDTTRQMKDIQLYPALFAGDEAITNLTDMTNKVEEHTHSVALAETNLNNVLTAFESMIDDEESLTAVEDSEAAMTALYSKIRGIN